VWTLLTSRPCSHYFLTPCSQKPTEACRDLSLAVSHVDLQKTAASTVGHARVMTRALSRHLALLSITGSARPLFPFALSASLRARTLLAKQERESLVAALTLCQSLRLPKPRPGCEAASSLLFACSLWWPAQPSDRLLVADDHFR